MSFGPGRVALRARDLVWAPASGPPVLGPVDLDLHRGRTTAIVGPNGAGKTTLLRLLAGVLTPSGGTIDRSGSGTSRREIARTLAYLPQDRPGDVSLAVERAVLLARYPHWRPVTGGPGRRDLEAVASALDRLDVTELRERSLGTLSGGERQLVELAGALAQGAPLWLLDEPTTHLDPAHALAVARLLTDVEGDITVVFSTHDLDIAARLARRVIALRGGRIVADGSAEEVLTPGRLEEIFEAPFTTLSGPGGTSVRLAYP